MGAAVLVFVLVTGLILGGYAAIAWLPSALARRRLAERLQGVGADPIEQEAATPTVLRHIEEGLLPGLNRIVSRTRVGTRLSRLIDQSGVRTTPSAVVVFSAVGAIAGAEAAGFLRHPAALPVGFLLGSAAPLLYLKRQRTVRLKRFEEQFPDALDLLARAVRAGHAFQSALGMAAEELPAPVGPELGKTFDRQNYGLPLRDALLELSERVNILDVRFFVTAVLIQRETGGNLSEILDNLSHVVRERFKVQRQVRVHTAHGRFTGYVLLAVPAFLAVALSIINPEHMSLLFRERMGQTMLVSALVLQAVGYMWIRRVIRIEV